MTFEDPIKAATRYSKTFAELEPERLDHLLDLVDDEIVFSDPFNTVRGKAAFRQIFSHMFDSCQEPRFTVSDIAYGDKAVYLRWRMTGQLRSWPRCALNLEGMSEIHLNANGLVTAHIDHWDSASQLLGRLPVIRLIIGSMLKLFKLPPMPETK